jgi:hypothetical protein
MNFLQELGKYQRAAVVVVQLFGSRTYFKKHLNHVCYLVMVAIRQASLFSDICFNFIIHILQLQ